MLPLKPIVSMNAPDGTRTRNLRALNPLLLSDLFGAVLRARTAERHQPPDTGRSLDLEPGRLEG